MIDSKAQLGPQMPTARQPTMLVLTGDDSFSVRIENWAKRSQVYLRLFSENEGDLNLIELGVNSIVLVDVGSGRLAGNIVQLALTLENSVACYDGSHQECVRTLLDLSPNAGILGKNSALLDVALTDLATGIQRGKGAAGILKTLLPSSTAITQILVQNSKDKNDLLDQVMLQAASRRNFSDFAPMIATVTWELVMNAIYSAPFDKVSQRSRYSMVDRGTDIQLLPSEYVEFCYADTETAFAVAVSDRFGRLPKAEVIRSISRPLASAASDQIRGGNHGAGVGYHMVVQSVSMLSMTVDRNISTTIVALFHHTRRRKAFLDCAPCILFQFG